ncbi:hypothetical protein HPB48_019082 [Haemaphysalis longicornis]|uniref:Uncharacterized protein n=1 Tax=Haemaphysalis longicornis TaxID=44386 RepID=A0A9J6G7V6_HAELO|nr:hypothetical protein HPB48_019082 [Haemaphysalis longicornis]
MERVQASEAELRQVIEELPVVEIDDDEFYSLNGDAIAKTTAEVLLRSVEKGMALTDRTSTPHCIYLFDKWDLSDEANERDLCVGLKGDVNSLLMKHARAAMRDGVRTVLYQAPHQIAPPGHFRSRMQPLD